MDEKISKIENEVQDRNSVAWKKICDYVEKVATENQEEFSPAEELGKELFAQIHTLPETISKLKKVKKISLYGSKLKRIPPEIGEMESLEYFVPYTSYDLHWFPYEITKCKNLKNSTVSTRTLYGNWKNRMDFPSLTHNPIRYSGETLNCSVCGKVMTYDQTNQLWISLLVGMDTLPLLTNLCSKECESRLPVPSRNYIQFAHKGGTDLEQPLSEIERCELEMKEYEEELKTSFNKVEHGKFSIILLELCSNFSLNTDIENIIRNISKEVVIQKGYFGLHADELSYLLYDIKFWLYVNSKTFKNKEQFLNNYNSITTLTKDEEFTINAYAPYFMEDWLNERMEKGIIIETINGLDFSGRYKQTLIEKISFYQK